MRKAQSYQWQTLTAGTCYYPEHWDESLWPDDLRRMLDAGITCVRIGEFAWNKVEPREGEFTFDFFDRFLDVAESLGMKVIFGTPTATPPAWLTRKYPEALNCRIDGAPYQHGMRRHYNYNSPAYQRLSARIVEKIAEHYAARPCVVGWQIDNEINCETNDFLSESDGAAFRVFLQEKYGTLDNLNDAWGAVFWNQTYTDWEEVDVPRLTIQNSVNPHRTMDYIRFVSDSAIRFCRMQSDILRKYVKPGDFITTNGMFGRLDNHRMTDEALDVYTYDSYPNFAFAMDANPKDPRSLNDRGWSRDLTEVRSICPHFGIMEQQSGAMGWNTRMASPAPKPGQLTLWALQSVAHGADYVSFFRWRTATVGTEIYWHGILNYDNQDTRKLAEVKRLTSRLSWLSPVAGAEYKAAFAVLRDYDNIWDTELDQWHRYISSSEQEIFAASQLTHTPMDYLYLLDSTTLDELTAYPLLIYPHPVILTDSRAELLHRYVEQGGTLIIGARAGQKDEYGRCRMTCMPGRLSEITLTTVKDYTFVGPADDPVTITLLGQKLPAGIFNDIIRPEGETVRVIARYNNNYYAGSPALTRTEYGDGLVLHFGGVFTRELTTALLRFTNVISPWSDTLSLPPACELCVREKDGHRWFFILNYTPQPQQITLHAPLTDAETGLAVQDTLTLNPYEVRVLTQTI